MKISASVLDAVDWLYASRSKDDFVDRAIGLAKRCYPSAVIAYHDVKENLGGREVHRCHDARADDQVQRAWRKHAMSSPVVQYYLRGGTDPVIGTQDLVSDLQLRGSSLYHECWKPFDVTHQVGLRVWGKSHVGGLSIKRDGLFRDDEQGLLRALHPHFLRAWRHSSEAEEFKADVHRSRASQAGSSAAHDRKSIDSLSPREREVLQWVSQGKRNREIGVILGTSVFTVNTQVESILRKLDVETRGAAATVWLTYEARESFE